MSYRLVRAKHSLAVGKELSDGGQGRVFTVLAHPDWVFKEYKPDALAAEPTLKARIQAMVHAPPAGTQDKHGHIVLTWPVDLVTADHQFVGFVMPRVEIDQAHELHEVVNPTGLAGGIAWDAKIAIAENLVRGVRMVHARNVVIGDFNERNILVWRDGRVTLLDCDSMQIRDGAGNHFFCRVGRIEFTAPELLRKNWNTTVRHQSSDLFALALHIHQLLLNGEHPFRGLWKGSGEKPEASKLAEQGVWAYGGGHKLQPRPNAPDISLVSPEIQAFFQRAFVEGARQPSRRPSTDEWLTELDALRRGIRTCRQDRGHRYRKGLSKCPWCAMEKKRAATRRPAPSPVVTPAAVPPITVPPPATPAPAPVSVSSRVSNRRTWVLVLALLITGLFPYFLGRWLQPEADIANLAYSGVPLAELLGWFQVALPPYLVGAGAILAAAALWSMRPAKVRRPIATMSLRRSVLGVVLVVLGLLLVTIVGPQRSQTLLASAPDVYQNSPVPEGYGPTLCSGILTWTSTTPGPVQTWRAEENKNGDCVRVQNYMGWAPGWEYKVGADTELQDWVMYGGTGVAHAWVDGGRDYLVGLAADNGKVRWRYRCPTSATSSAEFHNSDDSESPKGEYQGVSEFVKLECGSKTVRVRVSNGRAI